MVLEKSDQFDASRHALVQEFHDVNIDEFVLTKQMRAGAYLPIVDRLDIELAYSYLIADGANGINTEQEIGSWGIHNVGMGLRYKFYE